MKSRTGYKIKTAEAENQSFEKETYETVCV